MPDVAAFLRSLPEFERMPERAMRDLADRCEVWSFREDDIVRFPDSVPDARIWVGEGCLAASKPEEPQWYIGVREEADAGVGHWLRGQTSGWYVRLPFSRMTGAGDRVFRQSALLPVVRSSLPALFTLLFVGLGVALARLGTSVPWWGLWLLPAAGIAAACVWEALILLEWRRSFVALRGGSLELRRLDLGTREAVWETVPTHRVREAVLTRRGFWGLLGLAALELETDVVGVEGARFRFDGLPADCPLVEALGAVTPPKTTVGPEAWAERAGRAPTLERASRPEGDTWFRRHWWVLAKRCLPWLGWTALTAFVAAWAGGLWSAAAGAVIAAVALVPLGGLVWEVWDWANDRFGVTGTHVVLIHRRPLWLGETRQEAPLDQIEQVGVRRSGWFALVLDFGTVSVRLGPADPLEWAEAARPEALRQTVLRRRAAVFAERERQSAAARFDEMAEVIETWDKAQKSGY